MIGQGKICSQKIRARMERKPAFCENVLTPQEMKVLKSLARGNTQKQVARELKISPRTIEVHTANMRHKCAAHTLAHLIAIGFTYGWLGQQDNYEN